MPTRGRLVTAGIVTFVLGLVVMFPARVVYELVAPPGLAASGIDGSIWRGSVRELSVNGLYLRDVRWRTRPLLLLTGKLAVAFEANPAGGFAEGNAAFGFGGRVHFDDVSASLPLAGLVSALNMPGLSGIANARIERLVIVDGFPTAADGTLDVIDLMVPIVIRSPIGDFKAEFFTQENGVAASVEDTDAVFDLAGSVQLGSDRSYQFLGQVAPNDETPDLMRQRMQLLGSPNERGQRELRLEGTL